VNFARWNFREGKGKRGIYCLFKTTTRKYLLVSNKWTEQAQGERPYQLVYFRDISQTTGQHCTNFSYKNINTFSTHKCMVYKQPPQLETLLRLITLCQLFNTFFFHQQQPKLLPTLSSLINMLIKQKYVVKIFTSTTFIFFDMDNNREGLAIKGYQWIWKSYGRLSGTMKSSPKRKPMHSIHLKTLKLTQQTIKTNNSLKTSL